jgi:hypothetical protein
MTDRFHSLTVALDRDIRDDDAEVLMSAIRQLRGVAQVTGVVADSASFMAETRVRIEFSRKLLEVLYPTNNPVKKE